MKIICLLAIGLIALPFASAEPQAPLAQITVTGSGEVKVTPDVVDLNVSVESRNDVLDLAKKDNDDRVAAALAFLRKAGVKDKDIQTDYISVLPVYNPRDRDDPKPLYFQIRKGIGVTITDVGSFDADLTGLINSGVNMVQGVQFRTTDLQKYKDQARVMAINEAKQKAEAMAAQLGVKVGKPFNINISDWNGGYLARGNFDQMRAAGAPGDANPGFAVGQITVSATVTVSFLIE